MITFRQTLSKKKMTLPIVCFSSCSVMKIRKKSIQMILHYVVTFVSLLSEADAETEPENCESVLSLCVSPDPTIPFPIFSYTSQTTSYVHVTIF